MLVTPVLYYNPQLEQLLSFLNQGGKAKIIKEGILLSKSFSMDNAIQNNINQYPVFENADEYLSPYGVCDNIEQVEEKYSKFLNDPDLKYCISFTEVIKKEQSESGGWRWHKW